MCFTVILSLGLYFLDGRSALGAPSFSRLAERESSGLSKGPPPINTIPGSLLAFLVFGFSLLIVFVHLFT